LRRAQLSQNAARKAEFERLHHGRGNPLLGLAHQQMKVLGHDDVAHHHELIPAANLFENCLKQVSALLCAEQRLPPITTTGDEVQVSGAVVAREIPGHDNERSGTGLFAR